MSVLAMSEADLQRTVLEMAAAFGWRSFHARNTTTAAGRHLTAVAGDGVGFVDLVLARDRVIFAELKSQRGRVSASQAVWHRALAKAGAEVHVWRPDDLDDIESTLRREGADA